MAQHWLSWQMSCHVMSLSVTAYPFPWGHGVLLLEPIPAFLRARAGYSLDNSPAHRRAVMTIVTGIHWLLIRSNQQDEGFKKKKKVPSRMPLWKITKCPNTYTQCPFLFLHPCHSNIQSLPLQQGIQYRGNTTALNKPVTLVTTRHGRRLLSLN